MKRIWAPWRSAYVTGTVKEETSKEGTNKEGGNSVEKDMAEKGCVLCAHAEAPENEHRECGVIYQGDHCYVVLNRYPYTGGHIMIVPNRHVNDPSALDKTEYIELTLLVRDSIDKVREAFKPDAVNVGMNLGRSAGAGIDQHIHFHVVPRWNGDTNFMSVLSDTRVISQSLLEAYDILKPFFKKEEP